MSWNILFRLSLEHEEELAVAKKYFHCVTRRTECQADSLVIGRYSVLPFYEELEADLNNRNCRLVNSFDQHKWIANFEYYEDLKEHTPESWTDDDFYRCQHPGPFVLKGRTNSRKHQWDTHMFALTKRAASEMANELMNDPLIGPQGVIYRKFIPLVTFEVGINGLPFTNEWRIFYYKGKRLSHGYYWTNASSSPASIKQAGLDFADEVAKKVAEHVNFFVLDVAETESGEWILIEVNDGCMSGLSANDPDILYKNLLEELS